MLSEIVKGCEYGANHNGWLVVDVNSKDKRPNVLGYRLICISSDEETGERRFCRWEQPEQILCSVKILQNIAFIDRRVNPGCSVGTSSYNGYTCAVLQQQMKSTF